MTRARPWVPWAVVALVAIAALTYAQTSAGKRILQDVGLDKRPDRFVAFAFANVNNLPYSQISGTKLSLPVTIQNERGQDLRFTITATGAKQAVAHGAVSTVVRQGATQTVDVEVNFRCTVQKHAASNALPTARVVLTLAPSGESITHTMYCRGPV